jgi:hydrogenase nickel incorporation protein HypA/HybF
VHEFRQAGLLIRKIEQLLSDGQGGKVQSIRVRIGRLNELTPASLRCHFEKAAIGTVAEGASLEVQISEDFDFPRGQDVLLESLTFQE